MRACSLMQVHIQYAYIGGDNDSSKWIDTSPEAKVSNVNYQQDPHDYQEVPHFKGLHIIILTAISKYNITTLYINN